MLKYLIYRDYGYIIDATYIILMEFDDDYFEAMAFELQLMDNNIRVSYKQLAKNFNKRTHYFDLSGVYFGEELPGILNTIPDLKLKLLFPPKNIEVFNNITSLIIDTTIIPIFPDVFYSYGDRNSRLQKFSRLFQEANRLKKYSADNILKMKRLKELYIIANLSVTSFDDFSQLINLEKLSIGGVKNFKLKGINKLSNLKKLSLFDSTIIPDRSITELKKLEELEITGTNLKFINGYFFTIPNVKKLVLSNNLIEEIETFMENNILVDLDISGNQLSSIPDNITLLSTLRELKLNDNLLDDLPEGIMKLEDLKLLNIRNNRFKGIIGNNKIKKVLQIHQIYFSVNRESSTINAKVLDWILEQSTKNGVRILY